MYRRVGVALAAAWLVLAAAPARALDTAAIELPDAAAPGELVPVAGHATLDTPVAGDCDIWVDVGVATPDESSCSYGADGTIVGSFVVPVEEKIGSIYPVNVCAPAGCGSDYGVGASWNDGAPVTIVAPTVPDVHCQSREIATATLRDMGLDSKPDGTVDVVGSTRPAIGSTTDPGGLVWLEPASVPDFSGLTFSEAEGRARETCTAVTTGGGPRAGKVVTQSLQEGSPVTKPSELVTVTMSSPPTTLTSSPDSSPPTSSQISTGPTSGTTSANGNGHDDGVPPGPGPRPWWKQAALPAGGAAGLALLAAFGLHELRIHRPPTQIATGAEVHLRDTGSGAAWDPPRTGRLTPSFVLRMHTTYHLREPS